MTATYADDTNSAQKQEIAKNAEIPVDTTTRKIGAMNSEESGNSSSDEDRATSRISANLPGGSQICNHKEPFLLYDVPAAANKRHHEVDVKKRDIDSGEDTFVAEKEKDHADSTGSRDSVCDEEKARRFLRERENFGIVGRKEYPNDRDKIDTSSIPEENERGRTETADSMSRMRIIERIAERDVPRQDENTELVVRTDDSGGINTEKITRYPDDNGGQRSDHQDTAVGPRDRPKTDPDESTVSEKDVDASTSEETPKNFNKGNRTPNEHSGQAFLAEETPNGGYREDYDPECEMSFHEAVRAGDAKSVATLMARGVVQNVDEPDWNVSGDPPLLVAATNHCLPVLRALLASGCDPAVRSPRGETALHRTILNGGPANVFQIIEELLNHDCPPAVKEAGGGSTALHVLTRQLAHAQASKSLHHNFEEALKTLDLLAKVGPVNAKDHQGCSALHILASSSIFGNNHNMEIEPMIRTLLNAGADPALKNDRGETALHEALECGALNTAFLLIQYTPVGITSRYGETPLHIAAKKNQSDVVASLLGRGEDPSMQDAGGNTPLHLASARGFHQTVSLLITSEQVKLEMTNDDGLTALQVAAESGFVNAVRLLLNAGADPSPTADYCVTTLHHRHPDISVLIDHELTRRRQLAA